MRRIVLLLMALLVVTVSVQAEDLGTLSTADYVRVWCKAVDADGIEQSADSGHVLVSFNREATANTASFTARWTDAGATGTYIDSVRYADRTTYYFIAQTSAIDNDEGYGPYYGDVILFTGGLPWHNKFTFTLAADEFSDYLARMTEILGEVAGLDGFEPELDMPGIIFDEDSTGHKTAGSFGLLFTYLDSLNHLLEVSDVAKAVADSILVTRLVDARLDEMAAWLRDSLPMYLSIPSSNGIPWVDASAKHDDADTTWFGICLNADCTLRDTISGAVYPHSGGSPGDPPTGPIIPFRWPVE